MESFERFRHIDSHFASKQILKGKTIRGLRMVNILSLFFFVSFTQVHLQTQQLVTQRATGMAVHIVRNQGILALYNGLSASICRQVQYFCTLSWVEVVWKRPQKFHMPTSPPKHFSCLPFNSIQYKKLYSSLIRQLHVIGQLHIKKTKTS